MQLQLRPTRRKIRPSLPSYFLRYICVHRSEAASRSPETPRPHFTDHTPASESAKVDLLQTGTPASLRTEHRLAGWQVHTSCLGPLGKPFAPQLLHRGVECHLGFGCLRRCMAAMASGVCVIRATAREERKTTPAVAKTSTISFHFYKHTRSCPRAAIHLFETTTPAGCRENSYLPSRPYHLHIFYKISTRHLHYLR